MKKTLLALVLSGMAFSAQAGSFYVQGDLGLSNLRFHEDDISLSMDTKMSQRLSLGYQYTDNWRFALDYTNYGKFSKSVSNGRDFADWSAKISSFGASVFYDFLAENKLRPYVGLRLSMNKVKETLNANISSYSYYSGSYSDSDNFAGAGLLGGIQYKLTDNLKLNAGLEVGAIGGNAIVTSGNVGLRYEF